MPVAKQCDNARRVACGTSTGEGSLPLPLYVGRWAMSRLPLLGERWVESSPCSLRETMNKSPRAAPAGQGRAHGVLAPCLPMTQQMAIYLLL